MEVADSTRLVIWLTTILFEDSLDIGEKIRDILIRKRPIYIVVYLIAL
jgi:hypothetical protein